MFYNREKEQQELLTILKIDPTLVYFMYGPINSGKTNLINEVLQHLQKPLIPFYINLRGRNVGSSGDFLNVLFSVDRKSRFENVRDYLREMLKGGADIVKQTTGIPIPVKLFDLVFQAGDTGEDVFHYLEEFFTMLIAEKKFRPVFVLDELQMLKDIANSKGNLLLDNLFNFFVHMTKETHVCHCFAISSDSVFIQQIYGNARLEGRSNFLLIDDLDRDRALEMYDRFGFQDKERVWSYIGGKIGDMVILHTWLQRGYDLTESLETMLNIVTNRLKLVEARLFQDNEQKYSTTMDVLFQVGRAGSLPFEPKTMQAEVYFWVDENVLFLESVIGVVRSQGQLVQRAIKELDKRMI